MKYAVYFGSRAIYDDMIPAVKSLLAHSDVDKVFLLIEDPVYPHPLPSCVEAIDISGLVPKIFDPNGPNYKSNWTYIGLIRAALTKVFPDIDRILSIDCDTIVIDDISELWDIDLEGCYFAAVKEPHLSNASHILYTNVGVTLFDLKKLREDKKDDELIHALDTELFWFVSQDVLNSRCVGKVKELPPMYNCCDYTVPSFQKKIIHYAGNRYWRDYPLAKEYREMPWPRE